MIRLVVIDFGFRQLRYSFESGKKKKQRIKWDTFTELSPSTTET